MQSLFIYLQQHDVLVATPSLISS